MSVHLEVPRSWAIARVVLYEARADWDRSLHELTAMASGYVVPEPLLVRIAALERRHPLEVGIPQPATAGRARGVLGQYVLPLGFEEARRVAMATHGLAVCTRVEPASWSDGHAGVVSFCRGLALALDGVVFDPVQALFRPIAHHDQPMNPDHPVPLSEITGSMSIPTSAGRWRFRSYGMANLGLPDLVFEGVREHDVASAVDLLRTARIELVRTLRRGPGSYTVRELRVGAPVGRVSLAATTCRYSGERVLRLFPADSPGATVGDVLAGAREAVATRA